MHAGPATTVVGCHPRPSALARCARQRDVHSPRRSLCSPRLAASSGNREAKQHAMLGQGQPHGGLPNPTPTHLGELASALSAPHGPGASGRGRLGIGKSKSHPSPYCKIYSTAYQQARPAGFCFATFMFSSPPTPGALAHLSVHGYFVNLNSRFKHTIGFYDLFSFYY